jgi:hypothetical protein
MNEPRTIHFFIESTYPYYVWEEDAWRVYLWSPSSEQYVMIDTVADFMSRGMTSEAIAEIEYALDGLRAAGVTDGVHFTRLLYLLGLNYELIDDDEKAVQIYYQLWRDYPDSAFAVMARAKLAPINEE